ncbi:unnamed protein product [Lactuca saligna]|uniref:Protein kinase domain-containing protein n=1 Tax=Lactuca saligna TaxID=75948 RepID=A0AA35YYW8_LACSI|nr:unnamed protein product [Lactuca saligna]
MIKSQNLLIVLILISFSLSIISQKLINCTHSCPGAQINPVPYPFGFSSGCQIQLNCTSDGSILIGEFPVQQINPDGLTVSLPAMCGRPLDALSHLYGEHYAPMSTNGILMKNCTEQTKNCMFPMTTVQTHLKTCSDTLGTYGNVSCYSGDVTSMFLEYENVTRMGCRYLFSGVASEISGDSKVVSIDAQVIKLGWWLKGSCDCSHDADCTNILSPLDGSDGYRCRCKSGIDGDGYKASSGCGEVKGSMGATRRLIIGLSSGIIGIMLMLFVIICRKKRLWENLVALRLGTTTNHDIEIFIRNFGHIAPKRFKYSEIKKMTNSFYEKLGQGGYGSVYKGQMPDGQLVAVKLLTKAIGNGQDFINEVASIGRTSHVNIVTLIGFCFDGKKRALVYMLMSKGSLDKFLHGDICRLEWNTLFQIAKGIARGLEYLHQHCNTRIIHFDIKPHNILLDEDFVPKISDFGLAKLCKRKESLVSVTGARGTAGYMAPEVFFKSFGGASHKSDVYSYGMMVLEMTGARKKNKSNDTSMSEAYFPDWIYKEVESGDNLGVDGVTTEEEEELARKLVMVSLWCIQSDPLDRPSISKVVEMLEGSFQSLKVPPRRFWSSPARHTQDNSPSATQNLSSEGILKMQATEEELSS